MAAIGTLTADDSTYESGTPRSFSATIDAMATGLLLGVFAGSPPSSVTVGGNPATLVEGPVTANGKTLSVYKMASPPTGSQTIELTTAGAFDFVMTEVIPILDGGADPVEDSAVGSMDGGDPSTSVVLTVPDGHLGLSFCSCFNNNTDVYTPVGSSILYSETNSVIDSQGSTESGPISGFQWEGVFSTTVRALIGVVLSNAGGPAPSSSNLLTLGVG